MLNDRIIEYCDKRKELAVEFPNLVGNPKPKLHFLTHYPSAIFMFGPPMAYWTARYESRHRIAKNTANSAKNYKNISLTISSRQQMRLSSIYYNGLFSTATLVIPVKCTKVSSLTSDTKFVEQIRSCLDESDLLCAEVEFKKQLYKSGQLVVLKQNDADEILVGLILTMMIREQAAYVVTHDYVARRQPLQYFQAEYRNPNLSITRINDLADYKPLVNHGTSSNLLFCLHHHLSFELP